MPLLLKEFGTISIDIRDDIGRPVPFEYGRVTVTLHFDGVRPDCSEDELRRTTSPVPDTSEVMD